MDIYQQEDEKLNQQCIECDLNGIFQYVGT